MKVCKTILLSLLAVIIIGYQLGINIVYSNWSQDTEITKKLKDFTAKYITNQKYLSSKILNSFGLSTAWAAFTFPPHYDFKYQITGKKSNKTQDEITLYKFPQSEYPYDFINSHLVNFRDGKFTLLLFKSKKYQHYYAEYLCRKNKELEFIDFKYYYRNTLDVHTATYQKKLSRPYQSDFMNYKNETFKCSIYK